MIRCTMALALLVSVFFVGTAYADSHMDRPVPKANGGADELPPQTEFFDELDANADGAVSRDEYPHSAESFRLLDKDQDGKITTTELGLPADYRPDPKAKAKRDQVRAREERGDGLAGARGRRQKLFEKMDKNGDKAVSREEWAGRAEMFDRLDRNKDGVLDAKDRERGGAQGQNLKKVFERMDANSDGKISEDEMRRPEMMKADADGDGAISFKEFKAVADRARGSKNNTRRRRSLNAGQIKRFDKDEDGKVTREEFPGNDGLFARLDRNQDGVLTKDDIAAKRKKVNPPDAKTDGPAAPVTTESGSLIKSQDKDGDGKLNRAEFQGTDETWKQLDKNGDGWVTADEAGENK